MNPQIYTHSRVLAPAKRATPEDDKMLSRLATRAVEEAKAFGIHIDHKEGLRRARENLAFVKAMHGAKVVKP